VETPVGTWPLDTPRRGPVTVLFRPEQFKPAVGEGQAGSARLEGTLAEKAFRGSTSRIHFEVRGTRLSFDLPSTIELPAVGQSLALAFEPQDALQILDREGKKPNP
jgi:ABC-type Fe3+/spermidine/putrescine transport system ATPase subunit